MQGGQKTSACGGNLFRLLIIDIIHFLMIQTIACLDPGLAQGLAVNLPRPIEYGGTWCMTEE